MKRYWLPLLMFLPLAYPLIAASQGVLEPSTVIRLLTIAILVGGCSFLGSWIAKSAGRYLGDSQFWADEAGLLIALYGFIGPMIALSNPSTGLDQHLPFLILLALSCVAGISSILMRDQPTGSSA